MRFIKLLLSSSLIYIAAMAIANPTNDQKSDVLWRNALYYNLSDTILPLHYLIQVAYLRTDLPLLINYDITIHIKYATQHINFYLPNWNVSAVGLRQICTNMVHKIKLPIYYGKNYVMFDFDDVLLPDIYLLKMTLVNHEYTINNFRISTKRKSSKISFIKAGEDIQLMAHTQTKKQQIFPYWNNPKLRTTEIELSRFDIIINHHQQHTVLSNMPIKISKPQRYNITWTYFHTTPLMPIDSIALVVTGYHRISNVTNNKTVSMLYRPQLKSQMEFSLHIIENITRYLQNNSTIVCEKDSFEEKVDHVAILDLEVEVKQTLGFVFYREADIVYDEKLDPIPRKVKIAHIIARGMAQKCISNLMGPSWFDQWLNEGYKIYFETFIIEKALPNFRIMDLFVVQVQHELLDLNTYIVINSATEHNSYPENYYSSLSHNKGSIIWRMLELTLLHDIFAKGLHIYFNNRFREPEATTSSHLWNAMQSVMNALNYKLEFNIKSIIDSWATQSCFSVLEVMRNHSSNAVTISIRFPNKLDEKQYYIPVTYTTESEHNFTITWTNITWLTPWHPQEIKFFLEKDQWIIFNLQQAGYYRVYYDTENWQRIGRYLNSEKYVYIHVVNRAQIIDDAFHFAIEKKLKFSVFWEIAKYLSKENDIVAWYPMIKVFEFMSNIFVFSHSYPQFQKVVKQMEFLTFWNPLDQHNDRIEYLKPEVAKWRCFTDDNSCKTMASVQLRQDLKNPYENTLSPGWKRWAYCNGLKIANIWSLIISYIKTIISYDPTILECLAYVEDLDPKIVMNYLQTNINFVAISINEPKVPILTITSLSVFTLAKNTYMLEGILNILIKQIVHSSLAVSEIPALIVIINNVYSKGQLDEVRKVIRKEFQEPMIFDIERKIQTRWSEIEKQIEFLHFFID